MRYGWMMVALGLAGCAAQPDTAALATVPKAYDYRCEDGSHLNVVFEENHAVVTQHDGKVLVLPQMPSGSGTRYATPRYELRGKDKDATWTVGRKLAVDCRAER
ncbi:MAG: lysozyme inhibitor [Alphaproteobacteria bacterium]|nr:MAG: lysozyme inhibitor [Alphaproteobacteria bacterium]